MLLLPGHPTLGWNLVTGLMVGKVAGFRDRGVAPLHRTELSSELPSGSVTPTVVEKVSFPHNVAAGNTCCC